MIRNEILYPCSIVSGIVLLTEIVSHENCMFFLSQPFNMGYFVPNLISKCSCEYSVSELKSKS